MPRVSQEELIELRARARQVGISASINEHSYSTVKLLVDAQWKSKPSTKNVAAFRNRQQKSHANTSLFSDASGSDGESAERADHSALEFADTRPQPARQKPKVVHSPTRAAPNPALFSDDEDQGPARQSSFGTSRQSGGVRQFASFFPMSPPVSLEANRETLEPPYQVRATRTARTPSTLLLAFQRGEILTIIDRTDVADWVVAANEAGVQGLLSVEQLKVFPIFARSAEPPPAPSHLPWAQRQEEYEDLARSNGGNDSSLLAPTYQTYLQEQARVPTKAASSSHSLIQVFVIFLAALVLLAAVHRLFPQAQEALTKLPWVNWLEESFLRRQSPASGGRQIQAQPAASL
eukprot:m.807696 g.807696  ORF g.807696 m.807696 type:complete len:349 (+) comp59306_c0_seq1:3385-4431(+)